MTNYEKIKFLLEMGVYKGVRVKYSDHSKDDFMLIDNEGTLMGLDGGYTLLDWDLKMTRLDITSITPIPNPPKLLPVGTKVRVFEEAQYGYMKGIYEIDKVDGIYYVYTIKNKNDYDKVPARAVVPVFD